MTIEKLEQYRGLREEVNDIKLRIRNLDGVRALRIKPTREKVQTSDYLGSIVVRREQLREMYRKKFNEASDLLLEIEDYISTIDDADVRTAIRLKYIDGLTWDIVGERLHYDRTWIMRKVYKYVSLSNSN